MYLLTIVFLYSHVSVMSLHASRDVCELAADRARAFDVGEQAVAQARCEPTLPGVLALPYPVAR